MAIREYEHGFDLFGTRVRLLIGTDPATPFQATLGALRVQTCLQGLHRALTRFDPDSELCRLNARAGTDVPVSPTMVRALHAALAAAEISDGLVDPTILPDLERAGYAASRVGAAPARLETALAPLPRAGPRNGAGRATGGASSSILTGGRSEFPRECDSTWGGPPRAWASTSLPRYSGNTLASLSTPAATSASAAPSA